MDFVIIPFEGTDKLKLGMTSEENKKILLKDAEKFEKGTEVDDFGFCHVFYDEEGKSEAIEIFEPSQVIFNNTELIGKNYAYVKELFEKLDSNLCFEEGCGFTSPKYEVGIYAPYGNVEAVLVGKKGYYEE